MRFFALKEIMRETIDTISAIATKIVKIRLNGYEEKRAENEVAIFMLQSIQIALFFV